MKDRNDPSRRVWECPCCSCINVWNWEDAERASTLLKLDNPQHATTNNRKRTEIHIAHGSCFDNVCGGCGANIVAADSPILAEVFTHIADPTTDPDNDPGDPDKYEWDD